MTTLSLLYVLRGVDPEAAAESLKAREPLYGDCTSRTPTTATGGRQRRPRVGLPQLHQPRRRPARQPPFAVWDFATLAGLASATATRSAASSPSTSTAPPRAQENKGVSCALRVSHRPLTTGRENEYQARRAREASRPRRAPGRRARRQAGRGSTATSRCPARPSPITTRSPFDVPGGLFRNAAAADACGRGRTRRRQDPPIQVRVKCNSRTQYVGMASYDLYLRLDDAEPARIGRASR